MSKLKKCFIIFLFIVLLFVLYQIDCFAFTFNNINTGTDVELSDPDTDLDYFVNYYNDNYYLYIMNSSSGSFLYFTTGYISSTVGMKEYKYNFSTSSWEYLRDYGELVGVSSDVVYSSINIVYNDDNSKVFFQQAPLGITKTLVEETQKVEIMEQMKIMIVGFLKYLIVLVISLIAFWKGWQFLSTQLRKA